MKFGHFTAIILFCLSVVFAFVLYLDLQDGIFSNYSLGAPIFMFFMCLIALLFPGESISNHLSEKEPSETKVLSKTRIKIAIVLTVANFYCYFWAKAYFTNEVFFTIGNQLQLLLVFGILYFVIRWYLRSKI